MKAYTLIIILMVLFFAKAVPAAKDIIETQQQAVAKHNSQLLEATNY